MSLTCQRFEVNVSDAPNFHVIECQPPHQVNIAGLVIKICLPEIASVTVKSDSQFCPTSCICELNMNITSVDTLF